MNKYQEYLFKHVGKDFIFSRCYPIGDESNKQFYGDFDKETNTFTVTQDKDITKTQYNLTISMSDIMVNRLYVEKSGNWNEVRLEYEDVSNRRQSIVCCIVIDFNDRIDKIKFCFKGGLADDYILNLKYVESDKDAYYAEQAKTVRDNLLKTAAIKHSTGNDLVNIYFQPCCDEYQRTEITLYYDGQMIGKYKVDAETFFKSITGLAYGTYEYVLKQFGKGDKMLLESDKIKFTIKSAVSPYGGKGLVYWN